MVLTLPRDNGICESNPCHEIPGSFAFGTGADRFPVQVATPKELNGVHAPRWSPRSPRFRVRRLVTFQSSWTNPATVGYHKLSRADLLTWVKLVLAVPKRMSATGLLDPHLMTLVPVPCPSSQLFDAPDWNAASPWSGVNAP